MLPSVPTLASLCSLHAQMTWNWASWTNTAHVTWHRQGVQPNWTDLSDWGCGVGPPIPRMSATLMVGNRGTVLREKEKILLLLAGKFCLRSRKAEWCNANVHLCVKPVQKPWTNATHDDPTIYSPQKNSIFLESGPFHWRTSHLSYAVVPGLVLINYRWDSVTNIVAFKLRSRLLSAWKEYLLPNMFFFLLT